MLENYDESYGAGTVNVGGSAIGHNTPGIPIGNPLVAELYSICQNDEPNETNNEVPVNDVDIKLGYKLWLDIGEDRYLMRAEAIEQSSEDNILKRHGRWEYMQGFDARVGLLFDYRIDYELTAPPGEGESYAGGESILAGYRIVGNDWGETQIYQLDGVPYELWQFWAYTWDIPQISDTWYLGVEFEPTTPFFRAAFDDFGGVMADRIWILDGTQKNVAAAVVLDGTTYDACLLAGKTVDTEFNAPPIQNLGRI